MNGLRSPQTLGFYNLSKAIVSNSIQNRGNLVVRCLDLFLTSDHALIASEVEKLRSKRAIVETNHLSNEFISNLFLVPKKTGDLRPVINLKALNKFVRTIHFKMESIDC